MTKPIRIALTKEYLVMFVDLEPLPNASSTLSYSAQGFQNLLRYWDAQRPRPNKHLIVSFPATRGGQRSNRRFSRRMQGEAILLGWTVERCVYQQTMKGRVNIS